VAELRRRSPGLRPTDGGRSSSRLREQGIEPFRTDTGRTEIAAIREATRLADGEETRPVSIAGRIARRGQGAPS
jgi:hypothetical protein